MNAYPRLFTSLVLGGLTLRNRMVMPAFNHAWCPEELVTEKFI